jgi:predicted DNA-binding transcriptional regulator AlpA
MTELTPNPTTGAGVSLLRLAAVKERTGLGRTALYDLMNRGLFPAARHVEGTRVSVWPSHEVDAFVARQLAPRELAEA